VRPSGAGALVPPALQGDLSQFHVAELLQFLQLTGATGRAQFERTAAGVAERVEIRVDRGRAIAAHTTGRAVRLGDVLLHREMVEPWALAQALAEQRERPGMRLGAMLVEHGQAQPDQIAEAMGEVFRRLVCGLSLWTSGTFRFLPGALDVDEGIAFDTELDRLLLEGLQHADLIADAV
jgi:Domain of unknown function (DUF4388)